jgi:hypothetical protein
MTIIIMEMGHEYRKGTTVGDGISEREEGNKRES